MTFAVTGLVEGSGVSGLVSGLAAGLEAPHVSEPVTSVTHAPNAPGSESDLKHWGEVKALIGTQPGASTAVRGLDKSDAVMGLSKIIQLQTELQRHQLRIEVVSKVAECAAASIRKLQQQ